MRLIDADALTNSIQQWYCAPEQCGNNYGGAMCRACHIDDALSYIESAQEVEAIPIKPLATWLAKFALGLSSDDWESILRKIDWSQMPTAKTVKVEVDK